ncbi:dihydrolipoyl dehydrogenase [Pusillimonas sp.]|uniref:dihydrolipoyl dehydrogenase n=1 Tax=Pusillimonas sp. TaxID=3040095 RepID=UPI0037C77608
MKTLDTDVAIIGAGTAGLTAYRAVKSAGRKVVLIEGGPYGTMCARVGCMPSKLLIAAANAAYAAKHAAPFGVRIEGPVRVEGRQVMERVKRERDRFVGFVLETVNAMPADEKLRGWARFVSDTVLQVDDAVQVNAKSTVVATGSSPFVPDMYRQLGERLIVNDDVFAWDDLPARVLVVGTGPLGLELGQALSRLGVQVCVVGRGESLGGITDPVVKANALTAFQTEFDLRLNTEVLEAVRKGDEVEARLVSKGGEETVDRYDYVLMAAGRPPVLKGLGLENTSATLDDKGMPHFDASSLQVEGAPIFLAGDVDGVRPLLHEAADDGYLAGGNAARFPDVQPGKRRAPLSIVFSEPQITHAGMYFRELPKDAVVGKVDFENQGRSRIMLQNRGKLRVYAEAGTGKFLGAEMVGPAAEHIGHLLVWAVQAELTVAQMVEMPFYHPAIEEGVRTALRDAARQV